jgi:uncharacterized membrane protein YbhN (UPF0104 family)
MNAGAKQILTLLGTIFAVAGTLFVGIRLNDYRAQLDLSQFKTSTWTTIFVFTCVYGIASNLLALAWRELLIFFGTTQSTAWAIRVYGMTQLAKYVPSNVMHFAGRQAMGMAADIGGWALAKSTIWELGLLAFSGSLFSILTLPLLVPSIPSPPMIGGFLFVIFVVAMAIRHLLASSVALAFLWQVIFLIISSVLFVAILYLLYGVQVIAPVQFPLFCGAFIVAWLIGLVTPGAPAGIGVREAVILLLLTPLLPESKLLVALIFSRMVTIGGDVVFFFIASLCNNTKEKAVLSEIQ